MKNPLEVIRLYQPHDYSLNGAFKSRDTELTAKLAQMEDTAKNQKTTEQFLKDQIKKLVSADKDPSLFLMKFAPKDQPRRPDSVTIPSLEDAVRVALENRPEMRSAALDLKNKEIDEKYTHNQTKPVFDLTSSYNQNGVGGTQIVRSFRISAKMSFGNEPPRLGRIAGGAPVVFAIDATLHFTHG